MGADPFRDDRRTDVRRLYLDVVSISVDLLAEQAVAARWLQASVLPGLTVGALAAHLAGSALLVERFLDAAVAADPPISAERYYVPFVRTEDRDSVADRRVREQGMALAAEGHARVVERSRQTVTRLGDRLRTEPRERRVEAFGRVLRLDEFLRTRLVELTVHIDDLALSAQLAHPSIPDAAYREAIRTLTGTAVARHGALAVLRALARRERDQAQALRVL